MVEERERERGRRAKSSSRGQMASGEKGKKNYAEKEKDAGKRSGKRIHRDG